MAVTELALYDELAMNRSRLMGIKQRLIGIRLMSPHAFGKLLPEYLELAGQQTLLERAYMAGAQAQTASELGYVHILVGGLLIGTALLSVLIKNLVGRTEDYESRAKCVERILKKLLEQGIAKEEAAKKALEVCSPTPMVSTGALLGLGIGAMVLWLLFGRR